MASTVSRLADRLRAERRRRFVGRDVERTLFEEALSGVQAGFLVLHIFGPGGIGKTSLLEEFSSLCTERSVPVIALSGHSLEPSPEAFLEALHAALDLDPGADPVGWLAEDSGRRVLLLDTYEKIAPLDDWLREHFLPRLPETVLTVLAGRHPPAPAWRMDTGWQSLTRTLALRNFSPEEGRTYLERRAVPLPEHRAVLDFTHGHPLALSLVADRFAQSPQMAFAPEEAPDILKLLLERFIQEVPDREHRLALETCMLVNLTTEALLAEVLELADANGVFSWLRGLSFIESGPCGLFPHDIAREVLSADLRWRNRERYVDLHRRARAYYGSRLQQNAHQQQLLFDYIFLHRDNPIVRPCFEWQQQSRLISDNFSKADLDSLIAMVERHEGQESARLAAHWFACQPEAVTVLRDPTRTPVGLLLALSLDRATATDLEADPATRSAWEYLRIHAPLRPGEKATHFRFWMDGESYHSVSPVQSLILVNTVRHYLGTAALAFSFFPVRRPDHWIKVFSYADLLRIEQADFEVGGIHYGVYGHDWRTVPPTAWLARLAEREIALSPQVAPTVQPTLVALSQPEFGQAVRTALRDYTQPEALRGNPLLRSRLIVDRSAALGSDGVSTLRTLVREAVESLQTTPKQQKIYRAIYHTYLKPAATQEQAAELLDLPFSTFRRHLSSGVSLVQSLLWQWELQGY